MDQLCDPLVYIVDDDAAVRRALEFALDLAGFRVKSFESGEALLLDDLESGAGCVVLDERLPGISGLETLHRLRARGLGWPALLVTSHPKASFRQAAEAAGAPILEKPLLSDTLTSAIRDALARAG